MCGSLDERTVPKKRRLKKKARAPQLKKYIPLLLLLQPPEHFLSETHSESDPVDLVNRGRP
jgi:hypothetical protein